MALARKVILYATVSNDQELARFVEECIEEGVTLIAIVGPTSAELEDAIDWLIIGDGSDPSRYSICTTSHPDEPFNDVVAMVEDFGMDGDANYRVVRL